MEERLNHWYFYWGLCLQRNCLEVKTILVVIKFSLFQLSPKLVQINPKADNIRAESNNGYVHSRGSLLPFTSQVSQDSIWLASTEIFHRLGSFLISTSLEASNQNGHGETIPKSVIVITTWRIRRSTSTSQHETCCLGLQGTLVIIV